MFGSNQQNNTPFGGGGFGQSNPAPAFGSAPAPGGLFGQQPAQPSGFGAPAPAFGGGTSFGSTPFGGQAPAPSGGLFGQPSQPASGGGLFGSAPAPSSGFGQSSGFGAAPSAFGSPPPAPTTGLFGAPASTQPSFGGFGASPAPSGGLFGQPAPAPAFGAAPATTTGLFGNAPASSTGLFGSSPAPAAFGATSTTPAFGSGTTSTFGAPATSTFGAPATSTFGAPAPAVSGGLFGSPSPAPFGAPASGATGTRGTPYTTTSRQDGNTSLNFHSITAMQPYENKSFEELRMEDYKSGNRGQPSTTPLAANTTGTFFGGSSAPQGGSLFGQPAAAPSSTGLFGSAPAPSTGFGSPAPAPGGLFGQPAPAPAPFGAFGQSPAPAFGSGGFGSTPAPSTGFGSPAPAPGGLFGQSAPAPAPFGAFGGASSTASGSVFGQPAPAPFVGFGGTPAPSTGFAFNAAPSAPQPQAQAAVAPPTSIFPPNVTIVPPNLLESQKRQTALLKSMYDEVDKNRAWHPDSNGPASSQIGNSSPNANFNVPPSPYNISTASMMVNTTRSPRTGTKIKPRGYSWSTRSGEETTPRAKISELGRGGSSAGRSHIRSKHMQLVVKPNSLAPARLNLNGRRLQAATPDETITSPPKDPVDSPATARDSSLTPLAASNTATPTTSALVAHQQHTSPKPSPAAAALYREATTEEPDPVTSPTPRASVATGLVPTLTLDGYESSPSVAELSAMSEGDLAAVTNFTVRRPGYGEVAWEGAVDVRGIDLDKVVLINPRDVSVYQAAEEEGTKPPVGTKLNRPAIITFEEVFPYDDPQASNAAMEKFVDRLKKNCAKMDAEFIEYNRGTGVWKIRVQHFSRYGLFEDEEDEYETPKEAVKFAPGSTPARGMSDSILQREQTPFSKISRVGSEEAATGDKDGGKTKMNDKGVLDAAEVNAKEAYKAVFGMMHENKHHHGVVSAETLEEDVVDSAANLRTFVKPDEDLLLEASKLGSITSQLAIPSSSLDYGLRFGKMSRAGWFPTGSVCLPGSMASTGFRQARPIFDDSISALPGILNELYFICKLDSAGLECPLLQMPRSLHNGGDEESHAALREFLNYVGSTELGNKEAQEAFNLIAALLETPEASSAVVKSGGKENLSYSFRERRNQALLSWLVSVNSATVDRNVAAALANNDLPAAVFAALSGGDVQKATKIAAEGGALDLAITLSTGAEGASFIAGMISRNSSGTKPVPQDLVRTLRLFCGRSTEGSLHLKGRSNLSWQQRLALLLLENPSLSLSSLISEYDCCVKRGTAPPPLPQYCSSDASGVESVQYRILRVIADPQSASLTTVVNTNGFSSNTHDVSLSFLLAVTLTASGFLSSNDSFSFERLTNGLEAQLLDRGLWEYAIVVCLCAHGSTSPTSHRAKINRAMDIVLRFFKENDGTSGKHPILPSTWFAEALSFKSADISEFAGHILEVNPQLALKTVEQHLLPDIFSEKEFATLSVNVQETSTVTGCLKRLVVLSSQLPSLLQSPDAAEIMLDDCTKLESVFKAALVESHDILLPGATITEKDYRFMIQEALHLTATLRFMASSLDLSSPEDCA